jgi:hypothetical protein
VTPFHFSGELAREVAEAGEVLFEETGVFDMGDVVLGGGSCGGKAA